MKIGVVFEETSTEEFVVMLSQPHDNEELRFSYIELSPDGNAPNPDGERIIARVTSLHKINPLMSRDQASVSATVGIESLGFEFSRRFTYGWAKCTVIGTLTPSGLDMNRRSVTPNAEIHTPSPQTLEKMFFKSAPSHIPLGAIETLDENGIKEVTVTLNADQLVTKHFCVFGMTGSGKTNTSAKLLEELMARGHRMIVFDSRDDYSHLENFSSMFTKFDKKKGERSTLTAPLFHGEAVRELQQNRNFSPTLGQNPAECAYERLLRSASVIYQNEPIREFLDENNQEIPASIVSELLGYQPWQNLLAQPRVRSYRCFPELRFYGNGFEDYTILLLQAFRDGAFSSAQWRLLRDVINQSGNGIDYLRNLWRTINSRRAGAASNQVSTIEVLEQSINNIQAIYRDAIAAGAQPLEMENFFRDVAERTPNPTHTVFRLSLSDLSSNLRKAMVYAVVTYFFRSFKFGNFHATARNNQQANAYPVLFVLEEARSLIPKSSGVDDADISGNLARRAMREIAYEGRKFSLGFGLISQKPSTVDAEVVSQSNTFILHQLKSPDDQSYVRSVTESMSQEELNMINSLGTGRAIVAGVAIDSPVLLNIYQRYSQEGIEEPKPLSDELQNVQTIRQNLNIS